MYNEVEALTDEIQETTGFISRLISRKFGFLLLTGIFMGVILEVVLY